jgi:DNA-binding SARP family transcriptional activator/TolB-like protein
LIELRLFGAVSLTDSDGREILPVLAQPKRLGLLAHLAVTSSRGFQRRDTLRALFWAEQDDVHARRALNRAVYFLRGALGEQAIISRGDEELGVAPEQFWCDVPAFEDALARGQHEGALALYQGELLPGFFVDDGAEFERWLDTERSRLRGKAAAAASTLAARSESLGRHEEAVRWARRALEHAPDAENALRKLIESLDHAGDRLGALREYERFASYAAEELSAEPSPETKAVADRVRSRLHATPDDPHRGAAAAPVSELVVPRAAEQPAALEESPFRRHSARRRQAGVAATVLLALAVGGVVWRRQEPMALAGATTTKQVVAVLPFTIRGSQKLAYLGEGMVDLLSVNLDDAGDVRSADRYAVLRQVNRRGGTTVVQEDEPARAVARELGASFYVRGSVIELGPRLRLTASLYPVDGHDEDTVQANVEGEGEELHALVDRLTAQLLARRVRGAGARYANLAAATTSSLPALGAFLEGERLFRARHLVAAASAFRRAVEYDSSFALAYYRMRVVDNWTPTPDSPPDALERALRHSARLPEHYRLLTRALEAFLYRSAAIEAESLYRMVLRAHPDDAEAWFQVGDVMQHFLVPWGRPIRDVKEAYDRALALEPNNPQALNHSMMLAGTECRYEDALALERRLIDLEGGEFKLTSRAAIAFWEGDTAKQESVLSELRHTGDAWVSFASNQASRQIGRPDAGIRIARVLTEATRSRDWRTAGHLIAADLELQRGRRAAAWEAIGEADQVMPSYSLQAGTLFLLNPFLQLSRVQLSARRAALAAGPLDYYHNATGQLYVLGLLSARLGDRAEALEYATKLESRAASLARLDSAKASATARDLALSVRADLAWRRGSLREALALLEQRRPDRWWSFQPFIEPLESQAYERWMRAELLATAGRFREAIDWYTPLGLWGGGNEMSYVPPSRFRLGEMYERLGDREQAAKQYALFVHLWKESDPELRPMVEDAQRRIAALRVAQ